jgi:hypothetical protein
MSDAKMHSRIFQQHRIAVGCLLDVSPLIGGTGQLEVPRTIGNWGYDT